MINGTHAVTATAWTAGVLFSLLAMASPARGQTPPDPAALKRMSLEELSRLVVSTVVKDDEPISQAAASIYVLTADDIARSGATSIHDVLRLVPGVDVARIDSSRNWVVGIRGFGDQFSKSVLVLLDGRAAYTPLWGGVHWPIQDTLLEDIERIEVIRGAGGTIWGANAQNGVINIITRSAHETHGVVATVMAGNVERAIAGVRFGGGNGVLDYRVYAKGIRREPQYHGDGREFDTWGSGQGGFRVDWTRSARDTLTLQGDVYKAELGESVLVSTFTPPARFLVDDPIDVHGANLNARWNRQLASGDLNVRFFVDHTDRLGTDFGERRTTVDADAVHRWRLWDRHELIWGAGARTSPATITQTQAFSDFHPHQQTLNVFSAFVQDSYELVPERVTLTGGLKLEHNSYTGVEVQPSVRALWTPTERQTLWGSVTRAVRTPSRVDEDITVTSFFDSPPPVYAVIEGNRDIEAETVVGSEIGYRALVHHSVYVDTSLFNNQYDNLVDFGTRRFELRTTEGVDYIAVVLPWINGVKGVTRGVEVAPRWQVSEALRVTGSYSFLDIDLEPLPGNTVRMTLPVLENATPRHRVVLAPHFSTRLGIEVDPVYRYVSARRTPFIDAYHALDLRLGLPITRGVTLSIVGQNLLDPRHPEWARDPGPTVQVRRSLYARVTWQH